MLTQKNAISEIRRFLKPTGIVIRKQEVKINGVPSYCFVVRKTGEKIAWNYSIWNAYADVMSGYIQTWDGQKFHNPLEVQ